MSRTYANRTRGAQTTRPTQRMNPTTRGMSEELPTEAAQTARNVSPTRREPRREAAYIVYPPDPTRQQSIQRQAAEGLRTYEESRTANRPHYSIVETLGGGESSNGASSAAVTQRKLPAQGPNLTPAQRTQKYKQEKKEREEKANEEMKQKQRQIAIDNENRAREREARLKPDERRARAAWLDRVEGKSSGNATGRPADASSSASGTSASASGGVKEGNEMPDGLKQLENMFPWVEKDVLKALLNDADNNVDDVVQFLSQ